jgi:hypothetical protein
VDSVEFESEKKIWGLDDDGRRFSTLEWTKKWRKVGEKGLLEGLKGSLEWDGNSNGNFLGLV